MSRKLVRLPKELPVGTTYVLESRGRVEGMMLVHRYVRLPDGRHIELAARLVPVCGAVAPAAKSAASGSRRQGRRASAPAAVS
jgi:hypothetical protein